MRFGPLRLRSGPIRFVFGLRSSVFGLSVFGLRSSVFGLRSFGLSVFRSPVFRSFGSGAVVTVLPQGRRTGPVSGHRVSLNRGVSGQGDLWSTECHNLMRSKGNRAAPEAAPSPPRSGRRQQMQNFGLRSSVFGLRSWVTGLARGVRLTGGLTPGVPFTGHYVSRACATRLPAA